MIVPFPFRRLLFAICCHNETEDSKMQTHALSLRHLQRSRRTIETVDASTRGELPPARAETLSKAKKHRQVSSNMAPKKKQQKQQPKKHVRSPPTSHASSSSPSSSARSSSESTRCTASDYVPKTVEDEKTKASHNSDTAAPSPTLLSHFIIFLLYKTC